MEQTLALEGRDDVTSDETPAETIGQLFDTHHTRLYHLALRMTWGDDDARDLVQECFLRAIEHPLPGDPKAAERWLTRVLVNLCRDRHRRRVVRRAHVGEAGNVAAMTSDDPATSASLRAAVLALPARQRAVVILHEIEGRTLREIGELLGIAAVTARWHLHVALRSLRKELSR